MRWFGGFAVLGSPVMIFIIGPLLFIASAIVACVRVARGGPLLTRMTYLFVIVAAFGVWAYLYGTSLPPWDGSTGIAAADHLSWQLQGVAVLIGIPAISIVLGTLVGGVIGLPFRKNVQ